jgi:hypothetical protein
MAWNFNFFRIVVKWYFVSPSFWSHKIETKKLVLEPKIKRRKEKKNANLHKFSISVLSHSDPCSHAFSKDWIPSCYLLHVLMHGHFCKILTLRSLVYDPRFCGWSFHRKNDPNLPNKKKEKQEEWKPSINSELVSSLVVIHAVMPCWKIESHHVICYM